MAREGILDSHGALHISSVHTNTPNISHSPSPSRSNPPSIPIAVAYYRAGYGPRDYPTELEWEGRLTIESSDAFKCPSVAYQLVGSKKVQQKLAEPHALDPFIKGDIKEGKEGKGDVGGKGEREERAMMLDCFAKLWGLEEADAPGTAEVVAMAMADPAGCVTRGGEGSPPTPPPPPSPQTLSFSLSLSLSLSCSLSLALSLSLFFSLSLPFLSFSNRLISLLLSLALSLSLSL